MIEEGVILKNHSHYKIGGPAKFFLRTEKVADLEKVSDALKKEKIFIIGGGTNILFDDGGFDGLIVKPDIRSLKIDDDLVRVGAGISMADLTEFFAKKGFSGLEWAGGLPGTIGGAVYGNAGAFGGETKDSVFEVTSLDFSGKKIKFVKRSTRKCGFGYRNSVFKSNPEKEIILEIALKKRSGDKKAIREGMEEKIAYRKMRQPLEHPNIGSIFKNVPAASVPENQMKKMGQSLKTDPFPVIPAAYLIAESGLKGVSIGGAMISPKHPNFIVNVLDARSADVRNLIDLVKMTVMKKFSVPLEEEIISL